MSPKGLKKSPLIKSAVVGKMSQAEEPLVVKFTIELSPEEAKRNSPLQVQVRKLEPTYFGCPGYVWVLLASAATACFIILFFELPLSSPIVNLKPPMSEKILIGNRSHYFYPKAAWRGLNASSKIVINVPTPYVVISHTAGSFCYEPETCQDIMRGIQKYHMSQTPAYADIGYNFLIGGDGNMYEGRGWGIRSPHDGFVNNKNIGIALIGDFSVYDEPTPIQMDGLKELLAWGVRDCWLSPEYIMVAHSAIVPTLSPGKNIMSIISTWDHFEANPKANLTRLASAVNTACQPQPPNSFIYRVDSTNSSRH